MCLIPGMEQEPDITRCFKLIDAACDAVIQNSKVKIQKVSFSDE
jgi:hypothetical protein